MAMRLAWCGTELDMLAEKVLHIPAFDMLVLSDWHLGKLGHFRKEGMFVPAMQTEAELDRLGALIERFALKKVVFLGDLFHSSWNYEWDEFVAYLQRFPQVEFILTKGNHDLLPSDILHQSSLAVVDSLRLDELVLSHQPLPELPASTLNIVGHIHPGLVLHGKGRQSFRLPCFHLQSNILTLPAFGRWTGLHMLKKAADSRLFAIVGDAVLEV